MDSNQILEETGCAELNDLVLLCYDKHKDWRKCQGEMRAFKECFQKYNNNDLHRKVENGKGANNFPPDARG